MENQTSIFIEFKSSYQSFLYHLLVPLVFLLTWDCYSSHVVIILSFILLLCFSHYYYFLSNFFYYYYCYSINFFFFIGITLFFISFFSHFLNSFLIAIIFFTWCFSFHLMKSFNY